MNPIAISTAPSNKLIGRPFYDLAAMLDVMARFWQSGVVDGFEFQNTAEWDAEAPPRDEGARRLAYWAQSRKYVVDEIADRLVDARMPVLAVHANRDVGPLLCSTEPQDVARGVRLIRDSLSLSERVGARVCVLHLWDTRKEDVDPATLRRVLDEVAPLHPGVKAAVENVPTHLRGWTPLRLAGLFEWIALDLRWAAMYDELAAFGSLRDRIVDVHLRGEIADGRWTVPPAWFPSGRASFGYDEALHVIREAWGYAGLLTVESVPDAVTWEVFVRAVASVRETERT